MEISGPWGCMESSWGWFLGEFWGLDPNDPEKSPASLEVSNSFFVREIKQNIDSKKQTQKPMFSS